MSSVDHPSVSSRRDSRDGSSGATLRVRPDRLRLEAATVCQLRCPSCPKAEGVIRKSIGAGWLSIDRFRELLVSNSFLREIELSNWGEVFLNPDLLKIFELAHARGVRLTISNGANLNDVREDVLEGLVRFGVRHLTCSIDGATPETYAIYRRRGRLDRVLRNIETINRHKTLRGSRFPEMDWQFVPFGHNEAEIAEARRMPSGSAYVSASSSRGATFTGRTSLPSKIGPSSPKSPAPPPPTAPSSNSGTARPTSPTSATSSGSSPR